MDRRWKERRPFIFFGTGILVVFLIMAAVFYCLYQVSRTNLINTWNDSATQLSREIEFYLNTPKDAVHFSARKVEEMISENRSNEDILSFLREETGVYSTVIDDNSTGIYGYCRGEYLDGSGWTVPEDYVPEARPWYIAAKEANGDITFVKPFLNLQTGTMMMSVCKLLDDKESVLSMDIFLDGIQKLEEKMFASKKVSAALVIDKSGTIVSHSDASRIGTDLIREGSEGEKELAGKIFGIKHGYFTNAGERGKEIVFCDQINNDWYSVLILDEKEILGSIRYIYVASALGLAVVLFIFWMIISIYLRKHREAGELSSEIGALSDIYSNMDILDLKHGTVKTIRSGEEVRGVFREKNDHLNVPVKEIVKALASESSRSILEQFMDLATIRNRMGNLNTISHEYVDTTGKWNRMHFIVSKREANGDISKVIWAIQSIDEDKKRQEMFRSLSETDALTQILNRAGGEKRIFELLEKDVSGMLLILDADHFKYVNDHYGHEMGDDVIIALAKCLKDTFRDSDVVYRLGGDEFVAFATGVDDAGIGRNVVDRLFANINDVSFEGITDWKLQVSVGAVLTNMTNKEPFSEILQKADKAMYESKKQEGNRLTFAP